MALTTFWIGLSYTKSSKIERGQTQFMSALKMCLVKRDNG